MSSFNAIPQSELQPDSSIGLFLCSLPPSPPLVALFTFLQIEDSWKSMLGQEGWHLCQQLLLLSTTAVLNQISSSAPGDQIHITQEQHHLMSFSHVCSPCWGWCVLRGWPRLEKQVSVVGIQVSLVSFWSFAVQIVSPRCCLGAFVMQPLYESSQYQFKTSLQVRRSGPSFHLDFTHFHINIGSVLLASRSPQICLYSMVELALRNTDVLLGHSIKNKSEI